MTLGVLQAGLLALVDVFVPDVYLLMVGTLAFMVPPLYQLCACLQGLTDACSEEKYIMGVQSNAVTTYSLLTIITIKPLGNKK